jgi:hypothetical protein
VKHLLQQSVDFRHLRIRGPLTWLNFGRKHPKIRQLIGKSLVMVEKIFITTFFPARGRDGAKMCSGCLLVANS